VGTNVLITVIKGR